jgi:hypothetical protein
LDCYRFQHSAVCDVLFYYHVFTLLQWLIGANRHLGKWRLNWPACHMPMYLTWSWLRTQMPCCLVHSRWPESEAAS